jgi:hypothetical protein
MLEKENFHRSLIFASPNSYLNKTTPTTTTIIMITNRLAPTPAPIAVPWSSVEPSKRPGIQSKV